VSRPKGGDDRFAEHGSSAEEEFEIVRGPKPPPPTWRIRPAIREDVPRLVRLRELCYMLPLPEVFRWPAEAFEKHLTVFPEGQLVVETDGRVVAAATTCILPLEGKLPGWKTLNLKVWGQIAGHRADGDVLYLADLVVHPLYRRRHFALHLCQAVQAMTKARKLRSLFVVARVPGYHNHVSKLTAPEYVKRVVKGELSDVSLSFWLKAGFTPQAILSEFYPDADSCGYAVMVEWNAKHSPAAFSRPRNSDESMTGTLLDDAEE
jgi:ribosomal protein S18 acetylase RimI-like enzyme